MKSETITIQPPNIKTAVFRIIGTAPFVQNKFSQKARETIRATQEAGSVAKKGKKREPKDFDAVFCGAMHLSEEGWYGIPAPAFRSAMIDACRLIGFKMTLAKLSVFVQADGFDKDDGTPLVKLIAGEPERHEAAVRLELGGTDIRVRPMWREWAADVRVQFDADQFTLSDVSNLLHRAGLQVGVGEGRPNSRKSFGMGWGTFCLASDDKAA